MSGSGKQSWGYEGDLQPARWGQLSPCFGLCDAGQAQSPVDIPHGVEPALIAAEVRYQRATQRLENNGHSIQLSPPEGAALELELEGRVYALKQFHFHAHSEHTLAGAPAPMELHLVHADAEGRLLVLGVLIEEGEARPALGAIFSAMPSAPGQACSIDVNPAALLPPSTRGWTYMGSLTTPPCSEEVRWLLLSTPITASPAQLDAFRALYPNNFRPTQPLNGRLG